jgi:anti-sigma regulatory factor (Ser/Thr protein kinase)
MLLAHREPAVVAPVMYWRAVFPGRPDQARAVRAFVAMLLPDRPRLDEVVLAVGELVANALRHTRSGQGGFFTVDVYHAAGRTEISVTDQGGPAEPVVADADELAECGRGLRTVALLADSWGWHGNDQGRTVTAVFAAEPPATAPFIIPCSESGPYASAGGR